MTEYAFTIEGEPVAKGRPRFTVKPTKHGGHYAQTYTDPKTAAAEALVLRTFQSAYPGHEPLTGTINVNLYFYEGERQVEKQQDADNLAKLVLDALNGVAWADDRQITRLDIHVVRNVPDPGTSVRFGTIG